MLERLENTWHRRIHLLADCPMQIGALKRTLVRAFDGDAARGRPRSMEMKSKRSKTRVD